MIHLIQCDSLNLPLKENSVHCVITSPPYFGLRNYGVDGQLGLERVHDCLGWATGLECGECYVCHIVMVFREVRRVMRPDASAWINLGDSYASGKGSCFNPGGGETSFKDYRKEAGIIPLQRLNVSEVKAIGLKPKDLCMIPARVALALQADGWYLRSDIIWSKPNPMPESVTDRPTKSHEYLFLLAKSERYFYDQEAIKEPAEQITIERCRYTRVSAKGKMGFENGGNYVDPKHDDAHRLRQIESGTRNRRTVWNIATQPYSGAHFATFPEKLVEPCLLAGTSAKGCCPKCGAPWERMLEKETNTAQRNEAGKHEGEYQRGRVTPRGSEIGDFHDLGTVSVKMLGWQPTCSHSLDPIPCTVLDPFAGTGTVGIVSARHGRRFIGLELDPKSITLAEERTSEIQRAFQF